jgi:hypothetical protein
MDAGQISSLNSWARGLETTVASHTKALAHANTQATSTTTPTGTPTAPPVTGVSASISPSIANGTTVAILRCQFTTPNPGGTFQGVLLAIKNLASSSTVQEVARISAPTPGTALEIDLILPSIGSGLVVYFVSINTDNQTPTDWTSAPNAAVTLAAVGTAPAAVGSLVGTAKPSAALLTWAGNIEKDLSGYRVYRNTVSTFSSATPIMGISCPRHQTSGTYDGTPMMFLDSTAVSLTAYFYWVTAISTADQESTSGSAVTVTPT